MQPVMQLENDKTNYLLAPSDVLTYGQRERLQGLHIFIGITLAMLIPTQVLPAFFDYFKNELAENSPVILFAVLLSVVPCLMLTGLFLERILNVTMPAYLNYKQSLEDQE